MLKKFYEMFTKTWFYEQLVLTALVALSAWLQIKQLAAIGQLNRASYTIVIGSGLLTIVSQKLRSMGNRQQEQNKLNDVKNAYMSCAGRVEFWAIVAQLLSAAVSMAQASTWAGFLVCAYVALYEPVWRKLYRRWKPADRELRRVATHQLKEEVARGPLVVKTLAPVRTSREGERLLPWELEAMRNGRCPDCGEPLGEGPSGAGCVNMACANDGCGSRFNVSIFGVDRISNASPRKPVEAVPAL